MPPRKPMKKKAVKKVQARPVWEKALVWGGIALLILIVANEAYSQRSYTASLNDLDEILHRETVPLTELRKHTFGLAFRSEIAHSSRKLMRLKWMSLFRRYELWLTIGDGTRVREVATTFPNDSDFGPVISHANPTGLPPGTKGLPLGYENVVAVPVRNWNQNGGSSLFRELIRQSVLIAARDEMGLATLDASLNDTIPDVDQPASFPLEVTIKYTMERPKQTDAGATAPAPNSYSGENQLLVVELSRLNLDGTTSKWEAPKMRGPSAWDVDKIFESFGQHSLNSIPEGLRACGFSKAIRSAGPTTEFQYERLNRFDYVSQFTAMRDLQLLAEQPNPSPEVIGGLVRAYANLGSITDNFWNCLSKVFKARSLIYAQRLVVKTGNSPFAQAHMAYAMALAGRHRTALGLIRGIKSGPQDSTPDWLDLIEAYCDYRLEDVVQNQNVKNRELAAYLDLRMADPVNDADDALKSQERFLRLNSAGSRALSIFNSMPQLGVLDNNVRLRLNVVWPAIYQRISEAPDLPADASQIARQLASTAGAVPRDSRALQVPQELRQEHQARVRLMQALERVTPPDVNARYPSWRVLGGMLREDSFLEVWSRMVFQRRTLGSNVDQLIDDLKPLLQSHPLAPLVEIYRANPQVALQGGRHGISVEIGIPWQEYHALAAANQVLALEGIWTYHVQKFTEKLLGHADMVYEDQLAVDRWYRSIDNNQNFEGRGHTTIEQTSESWPEAVAVQINSDWPKMQSRAAELEKKYEKSPVVLSALSRKYEKHRQNNDALRCLKKAIENRQSFARYYELAGFYGRLGKTEEQRAALEKCLEMPIQGLEGAQVNQQLANHYMHLDDWKKAEPYALAAASSYSAWGLMTAAQCEEGLGKMKEAQELIQMCGMNYLSSGPTWYFWCVRTTRGQREMAKRQAEAYWNANPAPTQWGGAWQLVLNDLIENNVQGALTRLDALYQKHKGAVDGLVAAAIADKSNYYPQRDVFLKNVESNCTGKDPVGDVAVLLSTCIREKDPVPWDPKRFEASVSNMSSEAIPYVYYAAGLLLERHGEKKLGEQYLQVAASAFNGDNYAVILATLELRARTVKIGKKRGQFAPEPLATDIRKIELARKIAHRVRPAEGIKIYGELIESRPECLVAYIERGKLYESLANYSAAIADYEKAIEIDPQYEAAHINLGWLLAVCEVDEIRDARKALQQAQIAMSLRQEPTSVNYWVLAAAQAACGDFDLAIESQTRVGQLPGANAELRKPWSFYQNKQPYRMTRESNGEVEEDPENPMENEVEI